MRDGIVGTGEMHAARPWLATTPCTVEAGSVSPVRECLFEPMPMAPGPLSCQLSSSSASRTARIGPGASTDADSAIAPTSQQPAAPFPDDRLTISECPRMGRLHSMGTCSASARVRWTTHMCEGSGAGQEAAGRKVRFFRGLSSVGSPQPVIAALVRTTIRHLSEGDFITPFLRPREPVLSAPLRIVCAILAPVFWIRSADILAIPGCCRIRRHDRHLPDPWPTAQPDRFAP